MYHTFQSLINFDIAERSAQARSRQPMVFDKTEPNDNNFRHRIILGNFWQKFLMEISFGNFPFIFELGICLRVETSNFRSIRKFLNFFKYITLLFTFITFFTCIYLLQSFTIIVTISLIVTTFFQLILKKFFKKPPKKW